jgi:pimeloyl-ACP methyl ester carboxylesterase
VGPLQLNGNVDAHTWRSQLLGAPRSLEVPNGTLDYFDRGEGPALLFSHGWLANANLWRKVVDPLQGEFRCLVLDLPLGSHRTPMSRSARQAST